MSIGERSAVSRRECLGLMLTAAAGGSLVSVLPARPSRAGESDAPIELGTRRELFVDDLLFARLEGAELRLHKPQPRDVALVCDRPWEGNTSAYFTIFRDGDRIRAYYRGSHFDERTKQSAHAEVTCYAESRDGLTFDKPELDLFALNGSKHNNIIWTGQGTHNFTPFRDENPACTPDARYKALALGSTKAEGKARDCLQALKSADGIRWSPLADAVITDGAFDSQNLAFWDAGRGEYRAYWRIFTAGRRAIRTATSSDFVHWGNQADLRYVDSPPEHLYTNAVMPYFRAPHLFVAFPTRFQAKTEQVEPVFMTSRDGVLFRRWSEAVIPITAPQDRGGNRSNYMTWGLLQRPGDDRELSVYATEAYYTGVGSRVRRFTFRTDGFVSVHADSEATLLTKPLTFAGSKLSLNLASRDGTRVEVQDPQGKPLAGFALEECVPLVGDSIEQSVTWTSGAELRRIAGHPVRLRVVLKNADLFALQFA